MAQIRQRLHQDMQGVVAGAEAASDWKHYVRLYPFAAVGLAWTVGFLIVPRKRRSVTKTAEKAAEAAVSKIVETVAANPVTPPAPEPRKRRAGIIGSALGVITPVAIRAAQNYALNYVETLIAHQQQAGDPTARGRQEEPPREEPSVIRYQRRES